MADIIATAFWRRLDTAGHDCCRLIRKPDGWTLSGCSIFDHQSKACLLNYTVECDADWRTSTARVEGSVGFDELAFDIVRTNDNDWLLNGVEQPASKGCIDVDLGFTPATNLLAIRRLDPPHGVEIPAPAAYYLEFSLQLGLVEQTYRRTGATTIDYRSPAYSYEAELRVHPHGFVTDYPGLWSGTVAAA